MNNIVKCPECNKEMQQGYIFSLRRICWSDSADTTFTAYGSEELISDSYVKMNKNPALRCGICHLVIFKHK